METERRLIYTTNPDGTRNVAIPDEYRAYVMQFIHETSLKSAPEIAAAVQEGHDQILSAIDGLSGGQANFKPAPDEWSVLETMAHLVTVKRLMAMLTATLSAGALPPGFGPQFEEQQAQDGVTAARFSSVAEARDAAEAAHRDLLAAIAKIETANTEVLFKHFLFGAMHAREWACFQRIHDGDHAPQLARIIATPGFPAN